MNYLKNISKTEGEKSGAGAALTCPGPVHEHPPCIKGGLVVVERHVHLRLLEEQWQELNEHPIPLHPGAVPMHVLEDKRGALHGDNIQGGRHP